MQHGQITLGKEQRARLLAAGIRFFLTAALCAARCPGGYAPFALGCVSAAGPGVGGGAALAGAGLGALVFMDFAQGLPFLATAALIFTTAQALRGWRAVEDRRWCAVVAAGLFLTVGVIYVAQSLSPLADAAPCLASALLTGAAAWFYRPLLQMGQERLEPDGVLFLAMSLLLTLGDVTVGELSAGRALECALVVYAACQRGAAVGAAMGLGTGLVTDLCAASGSMLFGGAYGLGGLLAGLRQGRRGRCAVAFLAAVFLALLPVQHPLARPLMLEAIFGAGVFLMLPGRLFGGKRVLRPQGEPAGAAGERLRSRLDRTAAALRDLYDSMGRVPQGSTEENPAVVFDRAAEKVCRNCALCEHCWQREYTGTFNAMNDATPYLLERGRAMAKDFPSYFADRCIHLPDLISAINGELTAYLLRRQYRRELENTRRSARGQYAQLSELLTATAATLESAPVSAHAPHGRIGAALRPREGEKVCGDTLASFSTETGLLCLLLSDGMGTGEEARKESALTCRLLRQFLEAGIEPESALKTLNSAMSLRGADTGSFTTVDLLTCRTETGEAVFYKFGAAPSYVKKNGTVRRITGAALPVGLRGADAAPDVTRATLAPGSFAVLISDGVADANHDEWIQDLLAGWEGTDPQALATLILAESVRREGLQDDCGVQVLYLPPEGGAKIV